MNRPNVLSARECEIVRLLAGGMDWGSVQEQLGLSLAAAYQVRLRILRKLNLEDLTQVRLWASPITNQDLERYCGRETAARLEAVA